ncbi:MAG: Maf family protein, partial [Pseudomonadota bacterium]
MNQIILASKSQFRASLLENAGVKFTTDSANIDEREVEAPLLASKGASTSRSSIFAESVVNL